MSRSSASGAHPAAVIERVVPEPESRWGLYSKVVNRVTASSTTAQPTSMSRVLTRSYLNLQQRMDKHVR